MHPVKGWHLLCRKENTIIYSLDLRIIILNFFKKFLFIYQYVSRLLQSIPLRYNTLMPALFDIANTSCFDFSFVFSIVAKLFSFIGIFSFEKSNKPAEPNSSEYSGWVMITILFLAKNSRTSIDVWAGALSWCKMHDWLFHKPHHNGDVRS